MTFKQDFIYVQKSDRIKKTSVTTQVHNKNPIVSLV